MKKQFKNNKIIFPDPTFRQTASGTTENVFEAQGFMQTPHLLGENSRHWGNMLPEHHSQH